MLTALGAALIAMTPGITALSVDMPHGGCRLTVFQDGAGSIAFGAMPRSVEVPAGTFDFAKLVHSLEATSHLQTEVPIHSDVGSVSLPDAAKLRSITDAKLVRRLLEHGWSARISPPDPRAEEDHRWVSDACSFAPGTGQGPLRPARLASN